MFGNTKKMFQNIQKLKKFENLIKYRIIDNSVSSYLTDVKCYLNKYQMLNHSQQQKYWVTCENLPGS